MFTKNTYEYDQLERNTIENILEEHIDRETPKIIRGILNELENDQGEIEIMKVRNLLFEKLELFIVNYYRSGALLAEYSIFDKQKKIALLLRKVFDIEYLSLLSATIKNFYDFAILHCDKSFLLSDQYISTAALRVKSQFLEVSNRNIGLKETIILIPFSSSYYGVFWSTKNSVFQKDKVNEVTGKVLENINRVILNNSYKKCIGTNRMVCETVQKQFSVWQPSQIISHNVFVKKKEVFWVEREGIFWETFKRRPDFHGYNGVRNQACPCGSSIKFKKCHGLYPEWRDSIIETWGSGNFPFLSIGIPEILTAFPNPRA